MGGKPSLLCDPSIRKCRMICLAACLMRTLADIFAQIFRTLWAHKLRSF